MIWVEPFAGSLAVGLRALGHRHLVGWQGGKHGYAARILELAGNPKPSEVWCADVTDWANVWRALAKEGVAEDARSWLADLAAKERPPHLPGGDPQLFRALWMALRDEWRAEGTPETGAGVGRWLALVKGSVLSKGPAAGCKVTENDYRRRMSDVVMPTVPLPVRVWDNAHAIPPRGDAIVYLDPPYVGTTVYARDVPFSVPDLVADWTRAGATVLVSETVPSQGSTVVYDITGARKGLAGRTVGATRELLTVHAPVKRRRI